MAVRAQPYRDAWEQLVRGDATVTGSALLVTMVAASYGNRDGTRIAVTVNRLAGDTGLSPATVKRALAAAVDAGYLERIKRGTRTAGPSEYVLAAPRQQLTREPLDDASTAHPDTFNSSSERPQRRTREPQPGSPGITRVHVTRIPWCGTCDERTRQLDELDPQGRVQYCPDCSKFAQEANAS